MKPAEQLNQYDNPSIQNPGPIIPIAQPAGQNNQIQLTSPSDVTHVNPYKMEDEALFQTKVMFCLCRRNLPESYFVSKFILNQLVIDGVSLVTQILLILELSKQTEGVIIFEEVEMMIFLVLTVINLCLCYKAKTRIDNFIKSKDLKPLKNDVDVFDWVHCLSVILNIVGMVSLGGVMATLLYFGVLVYHFEEDHGDMHTNEIGSMIIILSGLAIIPLFLVFFSQLTMMCDFGDAVKLLRIKAMSNNANGV